MDGLRVESVDALSLDEALLLARELPHLRQLIAGTLPGVDRDVSRRLALGVLNVAQGHPKLRSMPPFGRCPVAPAGCGTRRPGRHWRLRHFLLLSARGHVPARPAP